MKQDFKIFRTFEEFVSEDALKAGEDSKIYVQDLTLDSGHTIKSAEILGAITASATEEDFKEYFFQEYGNDAFAEGEMDILTAYYLDKSAEEAEEEKEAEKDAEAEGGEEEDPLAGPVAAAEVVLDPMVARGPDDEPVPSDGAELESDKILLLYMYGNR